MRQLSRENCKNEIFKNMIALGALCYILDLYFRVIEKIILEVFLKKKGKDIVRKNIDSELSRIASLKLQETTLSYDSPVIRLHPISILVNPLLVANAILLKVGSC